MKYLRFLSKEKIIVIIGVFILFCTDQSRAQIGIGLPAGEEPQSALDVRFDSAVSPGFLMPRVNSFPTGDVADGMLVYYTGNSEDNTYYVYHNGTWTSLAETAGIVPPDTQAPTAPLSLTASNPSSSTIDLSWTASTDNVGVSGYKIYFNDGTLATTSSGTSVTVTGLVSNTAYTFYATAYDAAGNESTSSNTASETTQSSCVASTICETSFEGTNGCWTLFTYTGGSAISNTSSPGCSYTAYDGSNVIEIKQDGGVQTSSNDFTDNTSVDVSFWHTGYRKSGNSCDTISNTVTLEVSTNGLSWTVIESYSSSSTWQQATGTIDGAYMTSGIYIRIKADGLDNKEFTLFDSTRIDVNCD